MYKTNDDRVEKEERYEAYQTPVIEILPNYCGKRRFFREVERYFKGKLQFQRRNSNSYVILKKRINLTKVKLERA